MRAIDPTAEAFNRASGRVGCSESRYLVIGSTGQKNFRQVLLKLAAHEYVERIIQPEAE